MNSYVGKSYESLSCGVVVRSGDEEGIRSAVGWKVDCSESAVKAFNTDASRFLKRTEDFVSWDTLN